MKGYRDRVLDGGGYTDSCRDPEARVCPAISLPDLFGDEPLTQERIQGGPVPAPPYFAQAVVETDPETGEIGNTALLSFGIKVMPFDDQKELVDEMRALVDSPGSEPPPEGTEISVTPPSGSEVNVLGLAVLGRRRQRVARLQPLPPDPRRPWGRRAGPLRSRLPAGGQANPQVRRRWLPPGCRQGRATRARAAHPGRPRARVVGARPRRGAARPEPDVGDARRARDRDRDRVQRPALGPLLRGARARGVGRRGAPADLLADGRGGDRLRADRHRRLRRPRPRGARPGDLRH